MSEDFNLLKQRVDAIEKSYWELLDKMEQRIETLEIMLAQLIPAYGEVASTVEVIFDTLAKASPDEREELQRALAAGRKKLIDTLSYATKQPEQYENTDQQP